MPTAEQKMVAKLKTLAAERRERLWTLETPNFPGFEDVKVERPIVRSDDLWRNAERLLKFAIDIGGYQTWEQQKFGGRVHGHALRADIICLGPWQPDEKIVISCKWLRTSGTWDKKIQAEVEDLRNVIPYKDYVRAYGSGS